MKKIGLLSITLLSFTAACSFDDSSEVQLPSVPASWVSVDEGAFSFRAPDGFTDLMPQGIDSQVGSFDFGTCLLNYDYGSYSADLEGLSEHADYLRRTMTIDGKGGDYVSAKLIGDNAFPPFVAGIYVDDLGEGDIEGLTLALSLVLYCDTAEERENHVAILNSVEFN